MLSDVNLETNSFNILVINIGSTSTKVALFKGLKPVFQENSLRS
jgi:butyrate kinase